MIFSEIYTEVERRLKNVLPEAVISVKMACNNFYFSLLSKENWWFLREDFTFDTIAKYNTGTATVTSDSKTITGAGTTWTSAMVGRLFILDGDNKSYKIAAYVSGTQLTLETAYKGDTKSAGYGIYKNVYMLNSRAKKLLWCKQTYSPYKLQEITDRRLEQVMPNIYSPGDPTHYRMIGRTTSPFYNTGTAGVVANSTAVSGSGTTWTDEMIGMTFKTKADDVEYVISNVTSTTSLTLTKAFGGTTNTQATYEIGPAGTEQIELYPIPDKIMQIKGKHICRQVRLVNDTDVPMIPEEYQYILMEGAYLKALPARSISDGELANAKAFVDEGIQDMRNHHYASEDENPYFGENDSDTAPVDPNAWPMRE